MDYLNNDHFLYALPKISVTDQWFTVRVILSHCASIVRSLKLCYFGVNLVLRILTPRKSL
jgi:hypothetical protein